MRIWSLEDCEIEVSPLSECDILVFPLTDLEVSACDLDNREVTVFSDSFCDLNVYIPGPPGPIGPTGPQGPPGSSAGLYAVVAVTGSIPSNRFFTVANGVGVIDLTLPLISSIVISHITQPFVVKNISLSNLNLLGSGSDTIEGSANATVFPDGSYTLMPTTENGWLII